ncbi:MAG: hypothetical protein M0R46_05830 [Candidatus Muirbacterium halophilum]|nr:hypothetical protein [Candidatus Muirbacterium halophilum]MCK9475416.1 hypothetical protein [Candidatus Muirbacterium halophilum]
MRRRIGTIIKNFDLFTGIMLSVAICTFIIFSNVFFIIKHVSFELLEKSDYFKLHMILQLLFEKMWFKLIFLFIFDFFIMFFVVYFIVKIISNSNENVVHGLKKIRDGNLNFKIKNEEKKYNELVYTINEISSEYKNKITILRDYMDILKKEHSKCKGPKTCKNTFEKIEEELKRFNI